LVAAERYFGFLAAFLLAGGAMVIGSFPRREPLLAGVVVALLGGFLVPLVAVRMSEAGSRFEQLLRRLRLPRVGSFTARVAAAARSLTSARSVVALVLLLSVAMKVCQVFVLLVLAQALGLELRWDDLMVFLPIHAVVSALPLSLNGLGLREWNLVAFFVAVGLSADQAASLAVLHLVWLYATSSVGALVFVGRSRSGRSDAGFG
jgi:uncharacterized membrane protein YbhN (UPF0104 family)